MRNSFLIILILFMTPLISQSQDKSLKIAVIADIQYADKNTRNIREYRLAKKKLYDALRVIREYNPDFILGLGDLIDSDWSNLEVILPVLSELEMEKYHVLGNHEFENLSPGEKESLTRTLGMPDKYYSFRKSGWKFVMLNSTDLSMYANPEGSPEYSVSEQLYHRLVAEEKLNAKIWNGGISPKQLEWLEKELDESDKKAEKVIIVSHMPAWPQNVNTIWNYEEVLEVIEGHPSVVLFLAGHYHEGDYAVKEGIHHWTAKAMLDYPDSTAFSLLEVSDSEIRIDGFGREPDRVLSLERSE